jgi:hypothetical protein
MSGPKKTRSRLSAVGRNRKSKRSGRRVGAGRPSTGQDPIFSFRIPKELVGEIEAWADAQDVTRSDALRRLVEHGLKTKK